MADELDIINAMLAVNGEAPVSSISSTDPAAIQARNLLKRLNKKVQARGWWFNKECITLQPIASGEILVPQNALSVDPVDTRSQYVKRGTRLYDTGNNTYIIDEDVECLVILQLDISELPETLGNYLEDKAAKDYYTDDDGDEQKINRLEAREAESFAYLQRENLANGDVNIRRSRLGSRLLRETRSNSNYIDTGA